MHASTLIVIVLVAVVLVILFYHHNKTMDDDQLESDKHDDRSGAGGGFAAGQQSPAPSRKEYGNSYVNPPQPRDVQLGSEPYEKPQKSEGPDYYDAIAVDMAALDADDASSQEEPLVRTPKSANVESCQIIVPACLVRSGEVLLPYGSSVCGIDASYGIARIKKEPELDEDTCIFQLPENEMVEISIRQFDDRATLFDAQASKKVIQKANVPALDLAKALSRFVYLVIPQSIIDVKGIAQEHGRGTHRISLPLAGEDGSHIALTTSYMLRAIYTGSNIVIPLDMGYSVKTELPNVAAGSSHKVSIEFSSPKDACARVQAICDHYAR